MKLLNFVERLAYPAFTGDFNAAVALAAPWHRIAILCIAGTITAVSLAVQSFVHTRRGTVRQQTGSSTRPLGAGTTIQHILLTIVTVGLGSPLGREAALKQAGSLLGGLLSNPLTHSQRRLLIACGAGAGMAAAYNVPFGSAIFAVEVILGTLSLQSVLAATLASSVATVVSWLFLPAAPAYTFGTFRTTYSIVLFAVLASPLFGLAAAAFVRGVAWATNQRQTGWFAWAAPILTLAAVGVAASAFPEVLGNGKELVQSLLLDHASFRTVVCLLLLRPIASVASLRSGATGGLFTPTLCLGALTGTALGTLWIALGLSLHLGIPGITPVYALIGAGAVLAAASQGPLSATIFIVELTRRADSLMIPLLLAIAGATLTQRLLEPRSIYSVRD